MKFRPRRKKRFKKTIKFRRLKESLNYSMHIHRFEVKLPMERFREERMLTRLGFYD